MARVPRYGMAAILVPALLPPPAPFKMFVLAAGVAGMPLGQFRRRSAIGRGVRYFAEGLLAYYYGRPRLRVPQRATAAPWRWWAPASSAAVLVGSTTGVASGSARPRYSDIIRRQ